MISTETRVVNRLIELGYHIAFAESCTGGLLCGSLVNVPNASAVLNSSFITYANEAKIKYLAVSEQTIQEYGVVSEQVVAQMARGVARETKAEVSVATSGIAGPGGGSLEKPVGMVCFGFWVQGIVTTSTKYFGALGRNEVRYAAVQYAMNRLWELLN